MTKTRTSYFRGKVTEDAKTHKRGSSFKHIELPKGVKLFNVEQDAKKVYLDFLPYEVTDEKHPERDDQYGDALPGNLWFRRPFKIHRNVGVDNDSVVCLRSIGKQCPICEYREKRAKEGADKDELRELYGKSRSLYVVVPIGLKKFEEVPSIWDMSDKLFQEELNDELELHPEFKNFPALDGGFTASLRLKWKQFGQTSFPEVRSISFSERDAYPESILDESPKLDDVLKILTYKVLEAKWFETDLEDDAGTLQDVDDEPKPVRRSRAVKEDEDDEKPVRRQREKVKEDDEEEAPVRRRPVVKEEAPTRRSKDSEEECPHGHVFGVDTEDFNECDTCDIWGKCIDVKEKN